MSEVVALIDRYFWVILLILGISFTAFCIYVFSITVKSTKFEDVYSAEKLQLLASLDPNAKKEKKQIAARAKKGKKTKKPKETRDEPAPHQNTAAESSEPELESVSAQAEHNASHEDSDGSSKPSAFYETVTTIASSKKKQNKKTKKSTPEPVKSAPFPEPVPESVAEPIHVVVEEATRQQAASSKKDKTRTKRAVQREDITDIDEDKFIYRVSSMSDLEPEYLNFITQFIDRANADKYEFHGVQEQVFTLRSKLREADRIIETKDKDLAKIKNELVTARNGIHDLHTLQKVVSDEKAKYDVLKKQLEQSEASLQTALAKADDKEEVNQLKAKIAELDNFVQVAAASKIQIQKLQTELANAKKTPVKDVTLVEKVSDLQKRLEAAESVKKANEKVIAELQAELATKKQDSAQAVAELETLKFELDALSTGFIENDNLAQANNTFIEERKKLLEEIDILKEQNTNKDGAITKLNHELHKAYIDSREHLAEVEEMKKALAISKETEFSLTARLDVIAKNFAEHDEYYQETKCKIRELENKIKSIEREKEDLKQQLREERARVEEFEKIETITPVTSECKEQISSLEKALDTAHKKIASLEAVQEDNNTPTPAVAQEVVALKAKKNELIETNVKLAAAVRLAEARAKQIETDATEANAATLKTVVETLENALSSAGIKTNSDVPSSINDLKKWIQSVASVIKKAIAKLNESTPVPPTSSANFDENIRCNEIIAEYEERLETLRKQLNIISDAYDEYAL